jgi:hypothetical protein
VTTPLRAPVPAAPSGYYAAPARIFRDAGIPSSALRWQAAADPRFAALFLGVADAMDELPRRRPHLRLLPGGAA